MNILFVCAAGPSVGGGHVKRCHLANPEAVYRAEVLPEIAPELAEETR